MTLPKLTKREKQRVLDACELIATGERNFSCFALEDALGVPVSAPWSRVTEQYQDMLDSPGFWTWPYNDRARQERILALCLFWAAEGVL